MQAHSPFCFAVDTAFEGEEGWWCINNVAPQAAAQLVASYMTPAGRQQQLADMAACLQYLREEQPQDEDTQWLRLTAGQPEHGTPLAAYLAGGAAARGQLLPPGRLLWPYLPGTPAALPLFSQATGAHSRQAAGPASQQGRASGAVHQQRQQRQQQPQGDSGLGSGSSDAYPTQQQLELLLEVAALAEVQARPLLLLALGLLLALTPEAAQADFLQAQGDTLLALLMETHHQAAAHASTVGRLVLSDVYYGAADVADQQHAPAGPSSSMQDETGPASQAPSNHGGAAMTAEAPTWDRSISEAAMLTVLLGFFKPRAAPMAATAAAAAAAAATMGAAPTPGSSSSSSNPGMTSHTPRQGNDAATGQQAWCDYQGASAPYQQQQQPHQEPASHGLAIADLADAAYSGYVLRNLKGEH
jgi:hypothetical protein